MTPIDPELEAILDAARADPASMALHYLVAADWCEDHGDAKAAAGLRRMAAENRRSRQRGEPWCWFVPDALCRETASGHHQAHWIDMPVWEALRAAGGVGPRFSEFGATRHAFYPSFARAVLALARVLGSE